MFCKYCGKQIEDGQVCTCQQQQAPAPQGVKINFDFKAVSENLKAWLKDCTKRVDWITNGIFGVVSYLLYSIFFLCAIRGLLGALTDGHYDDLVEMLEDADISIPYGLAFWYGLLALIVGCVFTVGLSVLKDLIEKHNIDIKAHISRFFGVSLMNAGILLIGGLATLITPAIGMFFVVAAIINRVRDYVLIVNPLFKEKHNVFATLIIVGIMALILMIGVAIGWAAFKGFFEILTDDAFSGLGSLF